jgi:threonine aldolase
MRRVDLRSDTVSQPTDGMRDFMRSASVGDDVYEEDPTVKKLEGVVAELLGKESAVFVPSGTMGNLIAAMIHGRDRRSEIICGSDSHVARDEVGGISAVAGVHTFQVPNTDDGGLDLVKVREAVLADEDIHYSIPRAVFVETSHGNRGGRVPSMSHFDDVKTICGARSLNVVALHCDGARLWNAAAALNVPPSHVARPFDTVTCCLSKGLGCPMGSVLSGNKSFITEARWARKMLGGGMRQVGFMAAAGLYALQYHLPRIIDDHRRLSSMQSALTAVAMDSSDAFSVGKSETNILFVHTNNKAKRDAVVAHCADENVLVGPWPGDAIRVVMHCNVTDEDAERSTSVLREAFSRYFLS